MSMIRKKLNPIQANDGNICQSDESNDQKSTISPNDVLLFTKITDDYLCGPGKVVDLHSFYIIFDLICSHSCTKYSSAAISTLWIGR